MSRFFLTVFLFSFVINLSGQEEKSKAMSAEDSIKKAVTDSLKLSLKNLIKNKPVDISIKVLEETLNEIKPKPKEKKEEEKDGWRTKGQFSLLFNQSAFNFDWQGGGTSNVSGNSSVKYNFNYKRKSFSWENKINADYGLSFLKDEDFARKTDDRIEINSRIGQRIGESNWNYSFFANFLSQFDKGFRFETDPDTDETIRIEETHFFSPAFIQAGPGLLWKKSDDLTINIAPVTSRMIFVDKEFTNVEGYIDGDYFGVDAGESTRFEFGGAIAANIKFSVSENFTIENILNLYSNYIEDPANIDLDYTLNINLQVNRYISSSFIFQSIYDDNATAAFQIRQVLGIGLDYKF
ncbi:DUF3078 domain-containing protein [Aquimarina sp. 2304DJ70-9]|uniref:DUF3078 domain-containing protein n=1 Tax=Aquimarina penaris TaxID=3231044 RepID=UPI003461E540